ncbi:MAG: helicase-related protein, partial [Candidatus Babeliales bacterium]
CYLHSDLKTPQRTELLQKLRVGIFDCMVGVNLLREGLDLPEVALVAIMDADVEGYLRDRRSLIQTIGRAARNTKAQVFLYADSVTQSMKVALDETERRRVLQQSHNQSEGIIPQTVERKVEKSIVRTIQHKISEASKRHKKLIVSSPSVFLEGKDKCKAIRSLERRMKKAAREFDFDSAIALRNELAELKGTV